MKFLNRDHGHAWSWMILVVALCLFCRIFGVSEQTKLLEHEDGPGNTKVARLRRAPKRILDHSCDDFDCSQKKRAVSDEDFYCKVGNHKECEALNRMIKDEWKEENNRNYAKLSDIQIFNKMNEKLYPRAYRSLNYSITLPHEDKDGLKATMILTVISSKKDFYYSKHPLSRVFNFSTSKLTTNDLTHPRVISYPCVFGLDEMYPKMDYTLNITVIPYQATLLYYLQIYSQVIDHKENSCPVNNGIAVLNLQSKLHVVFESYRHAGHYQLTLYKDSQALQTIQVARSKNQHEFKLEDGGQYFVGIRPIVMDKFCNETLTEPIIWTVEVEQVVGKKTDYVNLASIIIPIGIVSVIIIGLIVFFFRRYRDQQIERSVAETSTQLLQDQTSSNENETTIPFGMIKNWSK